MKLGKQLALGCGVVVGIGILVIGGFALLIFSKKTKYDERAIPFFAEVMPVLSNWDPVAFEPYWVPEIHNKVTPEQMVQLFDTFRRLGDLEYYDRPKFLRVSASTNNPYGSFVTYSIEASYANGEAFITCVLVPTKESGLKFWSINIRSEALLEPSEEPDEAI